MSRSLYTRSGRGADERATLLYVEDNPLNAKIVEIGLRKLYRVVVALDDRQACQYLSDPNLQLAAVLMDIELQGSRLDGVQLTHLMRGTLSEGELPDYARVVAAQRIPIIFVTAFAACYDEARLVRSGANGCMNKPVDIKRLMAALDELDEPEPDLEPRFRFL